MSCIEKVSDFFKFTNKIFFVGFVTGPVLVVIGVSYAALTLIGMLFSALPSCFGCIDSDSVFHLCSWGQQFVYGLVAVAYGIFITCPGTSFISCCCP